MVEPESPSPGVYVTLTVGLQLNGDLAPFLDLPLVHMPRRIPAATRAIVGWGYKGKSLQTRERARRLGIPYLAVEDGFLRSVQLGNAEPARSLVVDDLGIYYDAHQPSRLERLIQRPHTTAERERARGIAALWRQHRLSKYNHTREQAPPFAGDYVLVIDQTRGDASISFGLADTTSFARMLEAALDEHPTLPVLLKVHPDVIAGRKQGHFDALTPGQARRVSVVATDAHLPGLLEPATAAYVVTSQVGFEALVWGKPVRCFGMPFYAGWGLTEDALAAPERRRAEHEVGVEDLVCAALVDYARYVDPETAQRCEPERLMEWMGLQRRMRQRHAQKIQVIGFAEWKRPVARAFFSGSELEFIDRPAPLDSGAQRVVWGCASDGESGDGRVLHVEDGFLRSVGLGADWVQPLSWVVDRQGMYYDATRPSELEQILLQTDFDDALRGRARALRQEIVAQGITKYNVGQGEWVRPKGLQREVVLVPGQVEDDASIRWGAPQTRRNIDLLKAVRAERPDAYIVHKPHPDVLAGKRPGRETIQSCREHCDELVTDIPMGQLLSRVDAVHVMTSLAGFEALLRGVHVVCHGQPFYSGWGLTEDRLPLARRGRKLSLDELVAGTLILYPTYVSRVSGAYTTPERVLWELAHWHETAPAAPHWRIALLKRLKRLKDALRRRLRS